ncbi:ribosome biogenesis GTPase Der [Granulicella cerasi]|uniref:GTPase Der n=1 Tax=Granulicella cerasi TaxID=741063 RepID=A0ABW1ZB19_9BACT|nr:ribosome biogenesis GTPase Der [Granulicella cerasi]
MAPKREQKKRLGKKHRSATTRPKQGKAPRTGAQIAGVAPKKRKEISAKSTAKKAAARTPKKSPEFEHKVTLQQNEEDRYIVGRPKKFRLGGAGSSHAEREQRELEKVADEIALAANAGRTPDRLPLVAICGRPNVGKSTLFNRLTGTRRSIVGDEPGITRDRIYGEVEWAGRNVRLVDTGGVVPDDEALIPSEIFRQAKVGLEEADAIIMVIDGRTEITSPDIELARLLQRGGKPLFLAVNKMDTAQLEAGAENFRTLGFKEVMPISAEHNSNIGDLLDAVWAALPPEFVAEEPEENQEGEDDEFDEDSYGPQSLPGAQEPDEDDEEAPRERKLRSHGEHVLRETKVAIIGRPNVGKSTLLNALTGTERAIVSPIAGTTRDAVDEVVERDGHSFRFIDTAGIRRKGKTTEMAEKLSVIMSRKHLEDADVALLIIDATEGVTALDANIGGYAHESGRSVIILVNKWDAVTKVGPDGLTLYDGKPPADRKAYEEQVRHALKYLDYAPLIFISALEELNVEEVFKKTQLVARERRKRISTGNMNRFLDSVDFQRASVPMNKRVKIYYMTQAAVAPPTFVLFTDRDVKLHFSYERFLANEVRDAFKFIGSPIWFKVKARNKKKKEKE